MHIEYVMVMKSGFLFCLKRITAFFIDSTLLGLFFLIFPISAVISLLITWFYFAGLEASSWKATFGKKCLGLSVVSQDGSRATLAKTSLRFFGKYLSAFILYLGYLLIPFTRKRQGLHDIISGCVVK